MILMVSGYLLNRSHTQQGLQMVNDSLRIIKEENNAKIEQEQAKSDSLQFQIGQINQQQQTGQNAVQRHQSLINEKKKQIDKQVQAYGIEQMLDTVSCRRNITIPLLRIADELFENTREPELKAYIQERYRKPWLKRMSELPF